MSRGDGIPQGKREERKVKNHEIYCRSSRQKRSFVLNDIFFPDNFWANNEELTANDLIENIVHYLILDRYTSQENEEARKDFLI